jgi:hypothetical protein
MLLFSFVWPRILLEIWLSALTIPSAGGENSRTILSKEALDD